MSEQLIYWSHINDPNSWEVSSWDLVAEMPCVIFFPPGEMVTTPRFAGYELTVTDIIAPRLP